MELHKAEEEANRHSANDDRKNYAPSSVVENGLDRGKGVAEEGVLEFGIHRARSFTMVLLGGSARHYCCCVN